MAGLRVVVVGATGNVGTSVVEALGRDAQVGSVVGLARRLPGGAPPKTVWARADVTTDDLVAHFRGADAVVHLAWMFQPTHDHLATWRNNVLGAIRVFEAVAEAGVPALVYSSSVGAYSPADGDRPVDESWPTHALPTAAYGREKSYLERVLDRFELSSTEALGELLEGLREGAGGRTPTLRRGAGGRFREREIATGVGQHGGV